MAFKMAGFSAFKNNDKKKKKKKGASKFTKEEREFIIKNSIGPGGSIYPPTSAINILNARKKRNK